MFSPPLMMTSSRLVLEKEWSFSAVMRILRFSSAARVGRPHFP